MRDHPRSAAVLWGIAGAVLMGLAVSGVIVWLPAGAVAAAEQSIQLDNVATPIGGEQWRWTAFMRGTPDQISRIKCVVYFLHPTFPNPVQRICNTQDPRYPFGFTAYGWGTFRLTARVEFADNRAQEVAYSLDFSKRPIEATISLVVKCMENCTPTINTPGRRVDFSSLIEYISVSQLPNGQSADSTSMVFVGLVNSPSHSEALEGTHEFPLPLIAPSVSVVLTIPTADDRRYPNQQIGSTGKVSEARFEVAAGEKVRIDVLVRGEIWNGLLRGAGGNPDVFDVEQISAVK
jgi:hypothetical protein